MTGNWEKGGHASGDTTVSELSVPDVLFRPACGTAAPIRIDLFAPSLASADYALKAATDRLAGLVRDGRVGLELAAVVTAVIDAVNTVAAIVARIDLEVKAMAK